jgi:hypothetical protein
VGFETGVPCRSAPGSRDRRDKSLLFRAHTSLASWTDVCSASPAGALMTDDGRTICRGRAFIRAVPWLDVIAGKASALARASSPATACPLQNAVLEVRARVLYTSSVTLPLPLRRFHFLASPCA